jgi:NAD(P)-dependent dehydrogenase (short-subunit alcohol dehydrogenase family)
MSLRSKIVGAARMPGVAWSFSRLGFRRHRASFRDPELAVDLSGQRCLVTGANGGLGFATCEALASRGAEVWMLCRDAGRGEAAREQLAAIAPGRVHLELVDMGDLGSIRDLVARLPFDRVDALVHNAGALVHELHTTAQDHELTWAVHVLGPQTLTRALLPRLRSAASSRVIWVASGGMYSERLSLADSQQPPVPFDGVRAYALAKRAQVILARHWAQHEPGVAFYAMHPGWAETPGVRTSLPGFHRLTKRWLRSPAEGADTAVWLAAARPSELASGAFAFDRALAPETIVPDTQATPAEEVALWDAVEASIGPFVG